MGEVVNLRQARKRKARVERERTAEASRLRHGQPKAQKERVRLEEDRARRIHEAHRRDDDP